MSLDLATPLATAAAATAWLKALWKSPYQFHIDDDPHDVLWSLDVTDEQMDNLAKRRDEAMELLGSEGAWEVYYVDEDARAAMRPADARGVVEALIEGRAKYVVWLKQDGNWTKQGDGPLGQATAERIAREIRADFKVPVKVLPEGDSP